MHYMIMFYETATQFGERADPAKAPAYWGAWGAYVKALNESGKVVSGAGLQPAETATTVRVRKGERIVQDGPFADAKEQLAGFFVIDVEDLDAALAWAARSPAAAGAGVEVRPVLPPMA